MWAFTHRSMSTWGAWHMSAQHRSMGDAWHMSTQDWKEVDNTARPGDAQHFNQDAGQLCQPGQQRPMGYAPAYCHGAASPEAAQAQQTMHNLPVAPPYPDGSEAQRWTMPTPGLIPDGSSTALGYAPALPWRLLTRQLKHSTEHLQHLVLAAVRSCLTEETHGALGWGLYGPPGKATRLGAQMLTQPGAASHQCPAILK
jgi:hypothetical protein